MPSSPPRGRRVGPLAPARPCPPASPAGSGPRLRAARLTWAWRQRTSKCNSLWETKAGGERGAQGERRAGGSAAGGAGRRYSQAAQRRSGAAHGARPGSTHSPGGITPVRGRPRTDEPRAAAAAEEGSRAGARAIPTRLLRSQGMSSSPHRAECLCAAAGAGGRWLLRSRSGREGNGPAGGGG